MIQLTSKSNPIPTSVVKIDSAAEMAEAIPRTGRCDGQACGYDSKCPNKHESPGYCTAELRPGGRRCKADTVGNEWLTLDVDQEELPEALLSYERVVIRTHSGRWHVLVRLERMATPDEYRATIEPWVAHGADSKALDVCRFLYAPAPGAYVEAFEGERLPVQAPAVPHAVERARPRDAAPKAQALPWSDDDLRRVLLDEPEGTNTKAGHLGAALGYRGWPEAETRAYLERMLGQGSRHINSALTAWGKVTGGLSPLWDGAKQLARDHGLRLLGDSDIERAAPGWLRHNPHDSSRPWFVYRGGVWRAVAAAEIYAELGQRCPGLLAAQSPGKQVAARAALLKQHEQHVMLEADLDPDPLVLCAPNGLIDLTSGVLMPHSPDALCSMCTGYDYDETLPGDKAEALILKWCGGDKAVAGHLRMLVGYTMTGLASERLLTWLHGPPGTAKSSCVDLLSAVLGSYAASGVPASTWLDVVRKPADSIRATRGRRLVVSSELKGKAWDEDAILPFTGGEDHIRAEGKYKSQIQWRQQCKLWVTSNTEPSGASAALQDRTHVIPFEETFEADPEFKRTLPDRFGPAFLVWAVQAAVDYLKTKKLPPRPEAVREATLAATQDDFGAWLATLAQPGAAVKASRLFEAWSRAYPNSAPLTAQAMGRKMKDFSRVYAKANREDGNYYLGLAVESKL